jgi:oligosaccharide repeat unit polymerase
MFSNAPGSMESGPCCSSARRDPRYLFFWLTSSAFILGLFVLWSEQLYLLPFFLVAGYSAVLFAFVRTVRLWSDPFNPLCLVLAIGFIRYTSSAFLLMFGVEPSVEAMTLFQLMGLSSRDWQLGHALALTGLLGVLLGWSLVPGRWVRGSRLNFYFADGIKYAALAGMVVGFIALSIFVISNASFTAVIMSGEFRGTTIQEGTGKYMYLGLMLISASVLLAGYLLARNYKWTSLVPAIVPPLSFWVLGGRSRAMTSLAAALLLLWYVGREQKGWERPALKPIYALAPLGIFFAVWILYVGAAYRGGLGIHALAEALSLSGLWRYIQGSIFTDIGHLYALAGAVAIGPGVLEGKTFMGSGLLWPLSKVLPLSGRSAGVFIVETLLGFKGVSKWGVHASLIGDAYLNFGLAGIGVVMGLFGALFKMLYVKFRGCALHSPVYILAAVYGLQIFVGSIEVWGQTLTVLAYALFIILLGKTIFQVR